jgi:hypothetical protein
MVICPIALAVHCTGCPFVKFCPAKTILGDYGKENAEKPAQPPDAKDQQDPEERSDSAGN